MRNNHIVAEKWMIVYGAATALGWMMVLSPLVLLAVQAVITLGGVVSSFLEAGGAELHHGKIFARNMSSFWLAGARTATISAISMATAMLFALPASFIVAKTKSAMNAVGWCAFLVLAGVPLYITVSGIIRIFSLAWLIDPGSPIRTLAATGLINGIGHAPLATLASSVAWLTIPGECEEAGLLVARPYRVWRKITFPLGVGGVIAAGILVGVLSACDMTAPDALTVRTWAEEVYLAFNLELNPGKAALAVAPLVGVSVTGMAIALWRGKKMAVRPLSSQGRHGYRYHLEKQHIPVWGLLLAAVIVMFWPLADLLWTGLSESNNIFAWKDVGRASLTTIACSGTGAALALFLAFPLAWTLSKRSSRALRLALAGSALLLFSIPTPLFGYAIAAFWNRPWWNVTYLSWAPAIFYDTPLATVALYATQTLPLAVLMLWITFSQLPAACLDAAASLSIRQFSVITRIVIPICRRGCLLTWAVCYLLTLRELGGLLLIAPPGWLFLAVRYATQIHFGVYADLAFLLTMSLPVALLPPLALVYYASRRNG